MNPGNEVGVEHGTPAVPVVAPSREVERAEEHGRARRRTAGHSDARITAVHDADWHEARRLAASVGERMRAAGERRTAEAVASSAHGHSETAPATELLPVAAAADRVLAHDLFALSDLPRFASSAMDGWAIGPDVAAIAEHTSWRLGAAVLAGSAPETAHLAACDAVPDSARDVVDVADVAGAGVASIASPAPWARPIATGAPVPPGTIAVLRSEHGDVLRTSGSATLVLNTFAPAAAPRVGEHIRPAGEEARKGDPLVRAGRILTAPRIALAAAAGFDEIPVVARPSVDLLLLGDEIAERGEPAPGSIRDALGPSVPAILSRMGVGHVSTSRCGDDRADTTAALAATTAPLVVTTGGSSRGPADHVRAAFTALGGRLVLDGVMMRPGHPVMLAVLPGDRALLCLPGNPLAALLTLVTVGQPLVEALLGSTAAAPTYTRCAVAIAAPPLSTRLVACRSGADGATPVERQGSGMLRGVADADLVIVVPPGGLAAGALAEVLPLPW